MGGVRLRVNKWGNARWHIFEYFGSAFFRVALRIGTKIRCLVRCVIRTQWRCAMWHMLNSQALIFVAALVVLVAAALGIPVHVFACSALARAETLLSPPT